MHELETREFHIMVFRHQKKEKVQMTPQFFCIWNAKVMCKPTMVYQPSTAHTEVSVLDPPSSFLAAKC